MFLIVGANSEIGSATARFIESQGRDVLTTSRRMLADRSELQLDLAAPIEDFLIPDGIKSACIFVAVARLAACAADPEGSAWINVHQTLSLVDRLTGKGIYTLLLSSNQVFSGDEPYVPASAPVSPVSEYGRQKAKAEALLRPRMAAGVPAGILRLSKVVSPGMKLVTDWRTALAAGRSIQAFTDMTLAPVPVEMVARSIAHLMEERLPAIAQLSGPRDMTYWELGRLLASKIGANTDLVKPTTALAAGMPPGSTPRYTTLDSSLLADRYGVAVPDVTNVLEIL